MLRHAALDQRRVFPRDLGMPPRARMPPVTHEEGRELRQRFPIVMGVDRAVAAVPEDLAQAAREAVGIHRLALDEPGVAEGGALPRRPPIDEHDGAPALLQMQRDRHADDAGSQHDHVGAHPASPCPASPRRSLRSGRPRDNRVDRLRRNRLCGAPSRSADEPPPRSSRPDRPLRHAGLRRSIFLGLALPGFAATARPLLSVCIFTFITLTFARADFAIIRRILRAPRRLILACLWLAFAPALLIGGALTLVGRESLDPGMVLGLAIIAAAPPILSGPAVAALLGIEPSLLLSATVVTTVLAPAVSPLLADVVGGLGRAARPLGARAAARRLHRRGDRGRARRAPGDRRGAAPRAPAQHRRGGRRLLLRLRGRRDGRRHPCDRDPPARRRGFPRRRLRGLARLPAPRPGPPCAG